MAGKVESGRLGRRFDDGGHRPPARTSSAATCRFNGPLPATTTRSPGLTR